MFLLWLPSLQIFIDGNDDDDLMVCTASETNKNHWFVSPSDRMISAAPVDISTLLASPLMAKESCGNLRKFFHSLDRDGMDWFKVQTVSAVCLQFALAFGICCLFKLHCTNRPGRASWKFILKQIFLVTANLCPMCLNFHIACLLQVCVNCFVLNFVCIFCNVITWTSIVSHELSIVINVNCCSPDDEYVAAGSSDGGVYIWQVCTSKLHSVLKDHR